MTILPNHSAQKCYWQGGRFAAPFLYHTYRFCERRKITIIPTSHKVFVDGQEINLTHKEYELLYFFMGNPGQIFSREQLLNRIWGYDFEGTTRTVDTHIKTLRQKLGDEGKHIVTLIRSGYKFEVSV